MPHDLKPPIPNVAENAKRIGVLSSMVKATITAVVSSLLTCLVAIPATLYNAGQKTATERTEAKNLADRVDKDHDGQIRLTATVQALGESVLALSGQVREMNAVHKEEMLNIGNQLHAVDSKVDVLGTEVRTVGQNVLRLSERVK